MNYHKALRAWLCNEYEPTANFNWVWFFTLTTKMPLTEKQAQRVLTRWFGRMQIEERFADGALKMIWVAEKFKNREGYHIHGLISVPPRHRWNQGHWLAAARQLDDWYQNALGIKVKQSGADRLYYDRDGILTNKNRCRIEQVREDKESVKYVTKYLTKDKNAWFDIFVSSPYFDRPKTIILPLAEGKICKRSARKFTKEQARLVRAENFRTFRANELLRGS